MQITNGELAAKLQAGTYLNHYSSKAQSSTKQTLVSLRVLKS